jgi:hypothetical protein
LAETAAFAPENGGQPFVVHRDRSSALFVSQAFNPAFTLHAFEHYLPKLPLLAN